MWLDFKSKNLCIRIIGKEEKHSFYLLYVICIDIIDGMRPRKLKLFSETIQILYIYRNKGASIEKKIKVFCHELLSSIVLKRIFRPNLYEQEIEHSIEKEIFG